MAKDVINDLDKMDMSSIASKKDLLNMTSNVVAAYLGNHKLDDDDVSNVIERVYQKLTALNSTQPPLAPSANAAGNQRQYAQAPAVDIDQSIQPDYIICLEDGAKLKMLKRHLRTAYKMTPEQYRAKWGLPSTYPMV
ncbi:MAG: MucR family transcriptional regulator, partial [Alphaproteobacteria bacterium]